MPLATQFSSSNKDTHLLSLHFFSLQQNKTKMRQRHAEEGVHGNAVSTKTNHADTKRAIGGSSSAPTTVPLGNARSHVIVIYR